MACGCSSVARRIKERSLAYTSSALNDKDAAFLDHCVEEGMLKEKNRRIVNVANTVDELLGMLGLNE